MFYTLVKVYQHSAHDNTLGPLDRLIVGPRYHRLHHEVDSRCNYAVSLTLFDILFRTAQWPAPGERPQQRQYGVSGDQNLPFGFWQEMCYFARPTRRGFISPVTTRPATLVDGSPEQ